MDTYIGVVLIFFFFLACFEQFNQVSGGVDLEMLNTVPVAGFQGKLTRVPKNVVPVPVEGPLSQSAGFIFDFNNQTEIFLGVSLTGTDIASQAWRNACTSTRAMVLFLLTICYYC